MTLDSVLETLPIEYRQFRESVVKLATLVVQTRLFPLKHPSCEKALSEAFIQISQMLKNRRSVRIRLDNHSFYYLNFEMGTNEPGAKTLNIFYNLLSGMSINEIEFVSGLNKEELKVFAEVISGSSANKKGKSTFVITNVEHIKLRNRNINANREMVDETVDRVEKPEKKYDYEDSNGISEEISRVLQKLNKLHLCNRILYKLPFQSHHDPSVNTISTRAVS